jgi:predicted RNA-binding Zn ribbon-like protein
MKRRRERFDAGFTPQSPWLDLVNSQQWDGFGRLTDHLHERSWVARFVRYWKFPPKNAAQSAHAQLARFRYQLRQMTERIAAGQTLTARDLRVLNVELKAPAYQQVVKKNQVLCVELTPSQFGWAWIRSRIAASFIQALTHQASRLKICPNVGCRWVFYDSTKGNVRRWCSDRRCGNRDRVRRARRLERSNRVKMASLC